MQTVVALARWRARNEAGEALDVATTRDRLERRRWSWLRSNESCHPDRQPRQSRIDGMNLPTIAATSPVVRGRDP